MHPLIAQSAIPESVALQNPTLYIALAFAFVMMIIVLRYISKRDERDDQRTLAFSQTLSGVTERSEQSTERCIDRCENMQSESNNMLREVGEHFAMHRQMVRDCNRCGNFQPKEGS